MYIRLILSGLSPQMNLENSAFYSLINSLLGEGMTVNKCVKCESMNVFNTVILQSGVKTLFLQLTSSFFEVSMAVV